MGLPSRNIDGEIFLARLRLQMASGVGQTDDPEIARQLARLDFEVLRSRVPEHKRAACTRSGPQSDRGQNLHQSVAPTPRVAGSCQRRGGGNVRIQERYRRKLPTRRAPLVRYEQDDGPLSDEVFRALVADSTGRLPTGLVLKIRSLFGADDDDAP